MGETRRVVIIGGGISGLALAHRLNELRQASGAAPMEITVLEASGRFGGVIRTERRDGLLLEAGPDAFLAEPPWMVGLCRRLGIESQVIETQPACRRSFIARSRTLLPVPEGWYLMAPVTWRAVVRTPLLSWRGKLRAACEGLIPPSGSLQDESVAAFIERRFGREALERIGQPMVAGLHAGDARQLSLRATLPMFAELEQRDGSVLKGLRRLARGQAAFEQASGPRYGLLRSFRDGMETLVRALVGRLGDVRLQARAPVARLDRAAGGWTVHLADGSRCEAERVCVTVPAPQAARLLASCAPELSQELARIPYESVATVNLAVQARDLPRPLTGFGMVVPAREGRRIVGCTFASVKFAGRAPAGVVLLRAFAGGALHRGLEQLSDASLEQLVRDELRDLLGLQAAPLMTAVARHPHAMPQYVVGHLDRVAAMEALRARAPGLFLAGNGYAGVGLPECVRRAEEVADQVSHGR